MHDVRLVDLDAPAAPAGRDNYQGHAVLVVREDRMKINAQRSLCDLRELAEEPEDGLPPAVFTGYLIPPAFVPQHALGEEVLEHGEIALGEGSVGVLDASDVRMLGYGRPLPVADAPGRSLEQGSSPEAVSTRGHARAVPSQTVWRRREDSLLPGPRRSLD